MPFVDVIYLKKSSLNNGAIGYFRRKTGQWLQVGITPQLDILIAKYNSRSPYVSPVLLEEDEWELHNQYRQVLERVNKNLKHLGKLCGIDTALNTYVARHIWATLVKEMGTPAAVISEGIGHTTEKTTRIYLKDLDHNIAHKAKKQVSDI
ncbi:tyrosine-type recombinase/integrase [Bacteroides thetaiotaomicron]|uniref:tyrosine-type recombinase/integrase n=1 Tax=Bacteroides thetaiotaomicron TaxID=818 RepID=UPI001E5CD570|nr:tyrosine-type recombinase/integrase [Bacteroides thetaiotaomicron]MDC2165139.1 tyrosine-type recombinase/integrase [Bacteroides thetaiotaomicron]